MRASTLLALLSVTGCCQAFTTPTSSSSSTSSSSPPSRSRSRRAQHPPSSSLPSSSRATKSTAAAPAAPAAGAPGKALSMSRGGGDAEGGGVTRRALLKTGAVSLASLGVWLAVGMGMGGRPEAALAAPRVGSGGPPFSKSGYDLTPLTPDEVNIMVDKLTELQKVVLTQAGTERPFKGKTVNGYNGDTKAKGTWVSAVSGVPLFSSDTKYDSGTGWPSFYKPIDPDHVIERIDPKDAATLPKFLQRTEVLDRKSGTHLGHVFDDGPKPTGKRYCMNAASMAFIPIEEPLPVKPSFKP